MNGTRSKRYGIGLPTGLAVAISALSISGGGGRRIEAFHGVPSFFGRLDKNSPPSSFSRDATTPLQHWTDTTRIKRGRNERIILQAASIIGTQSSRSSSVFSPSRHSVDWTIKDKNHDDPLIHRQHQEVDHRIQREIREVVSSPEATVESILQVVDRLGQYFDAENGAAVINRLGKLGFLPTLTSPSSSSVASSSSSSSSSSHIIVQDPRFHRLLDILLGLNQRQWTAKASTLVLNGLSKLLPSQHPSSEVEGGKKIKTKEERLIRSIMSHLINQVEMLGPRHISLSLNALVKMEMITPEQPHFVAALVQRAEQIMTGFPPQELATLINALAKIRPIYQPTLQLLKAMEWRTDAQLHHYQPQDLANTIHGFAKLGHHDPSRGFLKRLQEALLTSPSPSLTAARHPSFKPMELAMTTYGLAHLINLYHHHHHAPPPPFIEGTTTTTNSNQLVNPTFLSTWSRTVLDRLLLHQHHQHYQGIAPRELVMALNGLAMIGYRPSEVEMQHLSTLMTSSHRLSKFSAHELVILVHALSLFGEGKVATAAMEDLLEAVMKETGLKMKEFKGSDLATLIHSLGKLAYAPSEDLMMSIITCLDEEAGAQLKDCNVQSLSNLMAGFGQLGFYPGDELIYQLRQELLRQLPSLNARDLADVLVGWADLSHSPDVDLLQALLPAIENKVNTFDPEGLVRVLGALWRLESYLESSPLSSASHKLRSRINDLPLSSSTHILASLVRIPIYLPTSTSAVNLDLVTIAGALMSRVMGMMRELEGETLATFVWALSRAKGVVVPEVVRKEIEEATTLMLMRDAKGLSNGLTPRSMNRLLSGHVRLVVAAAGEGGYSPDQDLLEEVQAALIRWVEDVESIGTIPLPIFVNIMNALPVLGAPPGANLISSFVNRIWRGLSMAAGHDLAGALNAVARLHASSHLSTSFWTAFEVAVYEKADRKQLSPASLVLLITAMAELEHQPESDVFRILAQAVGEQVDDFETSGLVLVLDSMTRLDFHPGGDFLDLYVNTLHARLAACTITTTTEQEAEEAQTEETDPFGPPSLQHLVTLTRLLLRLSYHPGDDFLSTLSSNLVPTIKQGKRLAWTTMALAAFDYHHLQPSTAAPFYQALMQGVMLRRSTLSLGQLAAILWGLGVMDPRDYQLAATAADVREEINTLIRMVIEEACLRMQGGRSSSSHVLTEQEEEEGQHMLLECDVDALTIHARLRQAGLYFFSTSPAAGAESRRLPPSLANRFLTLVDGYRDQCLSTSEDDATIDGAAGSPSSLTAEGIALTVASESKEGGGEWRCEAVTGGQGGGQARRREQHALSSLEPDLSLRRQGGIMEASSLPIAVMVLKQDQYFNKTKTSSSSPSSSTFSSSSSMIDQTSSIYLRPLGGAAFRHQALLAQKGKKYQEVLMITEEVWRSKGISVVLGGV